MCWYLLLAGGLFLTVLVWLLGGVLRAYLAADPPPHRSAILQRFRKL